MLNELEQELQRSIFRSNPEKTSIDKVMGRSDIERIQELMKKERLNRSDILVLTAYMSGMEAKLFNLSKEERSVLLKFFVWISEYVKVGESNYDLDKNVKGELFTLLGPSKVMKSTHKEKGGEHKELDEVDKSILAILDKNEAKIEHIFKFLANLYLNISRTSLSQSGAAFTKVLEHKYDIQYKVESHNSEAKT